MKPKIFISSTVIDFEDLRGALKHFLEENGFEVQLSEYPSFDVDPDSSIYDNCLKSLISCQYFILLIGYRRGHWYKKDEISVTHLEYRAAKSLIEDGNSLKIITFVRRPIWLLKTDREGLMKHFASKSAEFSQEIMATGSTIIDDPQYIFNFINEVSEGVNYSQDENPTNNWIYDFNNFSEIITALRHSFKIKESLEEKRTKKLLIRELETNYNSFMIFDYQKNKVIRETEGAKKSLLDYFREKYKNRIYDENNKPLIDEWPFSVTVEEAGYLFLYSCMLPIQRNFKNLKTSILERVINEGTFLNFDLDKAEWDNAPLSLALEVLLSWLKHFKNIFATDVFEKFSKEMLEKIYHKGQNLEIEISVTGAGIIMAFIDDYRIPYLIAGVLDILKNGNYTKLTEIDFKN